METNKKALIGKRINKLMNPFDRILFSDRKNEPHKDMDAFYIHSYFSELRTELKYKYYRVRI